MDEMPPRTTQPDGIAAPPTIAHELEAVHVDGLVDRNRDRPLLERQMALVDRIISLENQLAEAKHRYRFSMHPDAYYLPMPEEPVLPYARARRIYTRILTVPVLGGVARAGVRAIKKVKAARS